jgi:hypothetical protein
MRQALREGSNPKAEPAWEQHADTKGSVTRRAQPDPEPIVTEDGEVIMPPDPRGMDGNARPAPEPEPPQRRRAQPEPQPEPEPPRRRRNGASKPQQQAQQPAEPPRRRRTGSKASQGKPASPRAAEPPPEPDKDDVPFDADFDEGEPADDTPMREMGDDTEQVQGKLL